MAPHKYNAEEVIAAFKKPTQKKTSVEKKSLMIIDFWNDKIQLLFYV